MKLIVLDTHDPHLNLSIEEHLFRNSTDDIFMLWQNEPTVVIGKNQNVYAEIDTELAAARGIHIARRITGGGAVYHDLGNVNYSFIKNAAEEGIDFSTYTRPIISALHTLGVDCTLSGRNDLMLGDKKISGNAQFTSNGRTLHHGTILFDSDLTALSDVLRVDEEKIRSKAIRSTVSRVTNIKPALTGLISVDEFIATISEFIQREYNAVITEPPTAHEVSELLLRNRSREWLYPDRSLSAKYNLIRKKKLPSCLLVIELEMTNDTIISAAISGDFFGTRDVSELEEILTGIRITDASKVLSDIDVEKYIFGVTSDAFTEIITRP
jgi:lipoate-protein ligase A